MTAPRRGVSTRRKKVIAFTLAEMLVVMAIIATLAAVLLPSLSSALEAGRRTKCLGNMKQVGAALLLYANDHNATLPVVYDATAPDGSMYWYNAVSTTLGQDEWAAWQTDGLFACPDSTNGVPAYTMSWAVSGQRLAHLKSYLIIVADGNGASGAGFNASPPYGGIDTARHRGGANYLYVDGHVEFLKQIPTDSITP